MIATSLNLCFRAARTVVINSRRVKSRITHSLLVRNMDGLTHYPKNKLLVLTEEIQDNKRNVNVEKTTSNFTSGSSEQTEGKILTFVMLFRFDSVNGPKTVIFRRQASDTWESTVCRIVKKLSGLNKSKKRSHGDSVQQDESGSFEIELFDRNRVLLWSSRKVTEGDQASQERELKVSEVLSHQGGVLKIEGSSYEINFNPPHIESFKLEQNLLCGCPVLPKVDTVHCEVTDVQYLWFLGNVENSELPVLKLSEEFPYFSVEGFTFRASGLVFIPGEEDKGKHICVVAVPGSNSVVRAYVNLKFVVQECPQKFLWTDRQKYFCGSPCAENDIRIVCYNILADLYLDLKPEPDQLWFPYCPKEYQKAEYRYPLILKELEEYRADIFCLQEVDFKFYKRYLRFYMNSLGFEGRFLVKGCDVNEGLALFCRKEKFSLMEEFDVLLSDLLYTENFAAGRMLAEAAQLSSEVFQLLATRPTVLQVDLLSGPSERLILVANTHLYYKPEDPHIRLLQTALAVKYLDFVRDSLTVKHPGKKVGVIFCGDFNSVPTTGVVEFLTNAYLSPDHHEWSAGSSETEKFVGVELRSNVKFVNSCGIDSYTNYTKQSKERGFVGCLDYIWIDSDAFSLKKIIPPPAHEFVTKYTAIPSEIAPSDHVPVICDVIAL